MTAVDFLRHGETEANDALLGRTDAPLSAAGRAAVVRQIGGRRWHAIVSSPLGRAQETAALCAAASGQPVEIDPAWREIDFGDWDGKPHCDLATEKRLASFYERPADNPPPNGEPMHDVHARLADALRRLAARSEGPMLVVTHAGAIRVALSVLLAIPLERLWALRIACATLVRVEIGVDPKHGLWGEIVEIVQPPGGEGP